MMGGLFEETRLVFFIENIQVCRIAGISSVVLVGFESYSA